MPESPVPQTSDTDCSRSNAASADESTLPAAIDGRQLLDVLERAFARYLHLPEHASTLLALWVVHTHATEAAMHFPILLARSPEKGCGKTTLLQVLCALVRDPAMGAEFTPAALFRTIEASHPTILLDEGDMIFPGNRDLQRIFNGGHSRGAAIHKTEPLPGGGHKPVAYSTWGPKAIATIGSVLPATTMDRCLVVNLQRKPGGVDLVRFTDDEASALHIVREQVAQWVRDNVAALKLADAATVVPFANRRADNWRPLLAIADAVSADCGRKARESALALAELQPEAPSESQMLLADMRAYFELERATHCPTEVFRDWLGEREDRPWKDFHGYGRLISAAMIASTMRTYGIAPRKYWIGKNEYSRGYPLDAKLQQVFETYVVEPVEPAERLEGVPDVPDVPDKPKASSGTINLRRGRINP